MKMVLAGSSSSSISSLVVAGRLGRWWVVAQVLLLLLGGASRAAVPSESSSSSVFRHGGTTSTRNVDSGSTTTERNEMEDVGSSSNLEALTPKIIGGTLASLGEYPYYAIPQTGVQGYGLCGSVKIWDDILLSAGHCRGVFQGNNIFIGGTLRSGANAPETIRAVSELRHPNYKEATTEYDFLLVKLQQRSSAPSVPWNTDRNFPSNGAQVWTIGYGFTAENGPVSDNLRKVSLNIVDYASCFNVYGGDIFDNTMICAYKDNADSCLGDR